MSEQKKLEEKRHTLAHLLAAAILEMYPDALPTLGPVTPSGFYYDFGNLKISDKDLSAVEKRMKELLKEWTSMEGTEITEKDARDRFKNNPYKLELIDKIVGKGEKITIYTSGGWSDLCRGGHTKNPAKEISPDSFKLSRAAGAYWRGDEKNEMLARIYGLAFDNKENLAAHEKQLEEAVKRDHRRLGKELDLFVFSDLIGAGLPLFTPKGTILRDLLDDRVWKLRRERGYQRVDIPHITKKDLYIKSGHWDKFGDELFRMQTREKHEFVMKPMNCPHHIQIFDRKMWSYRELPVRYASTTKVYRDEQTGELSGLSRVRSITQDDSHVFCRQDQVKDEIRKIWKIVTEFYSSSRFSLTPRLSLHNPNEMEKYLGTKEIWQEAEDKLRGIVKENGVSAIEAPGEAAFYGPKLDFMAKDSLGREWQVATIQLDMNLPERFDLNCINEKGEKERIVIIHSAIMGAIERFLSILIEHLNGEFPFWLSPVQVKILPVGENQKEYANKIAESLLDKDFRVEVDNSDENLGKKVRNAKVEKIPFFIVIGAKEMEEEKVTLESRDNGQIGLISLEELTATLAKEK